MFRPIVVAAALLTVLACDSKNLSDPNDQPILGKSPTGGYVLPKISESSANVTATATGPLHNPQTQIGQLISCFSGPSEGTEFGGSCVRWASKNGAEIRTNGGDPDGEYAGVYPQPQSDIRGKLLGQVNELGFSYAGGPPSGGTPRWSIPIDENNNGTRDADEQYAFIAADRCNDGDANVGRVDGDDDPTCLIDHKGVAYDNWDTFAGAHPTWRVARREIGGGSPAFTFVVLDGLPTHYIIWQVQAN